ncbi:hypothetical protein [Nocardia rhizosphaerae]|uniref:Uncharacterized protein n=1 Tax=Nocardia rhizosphaerae TaxID=1691571 RepID=A0ABV8LDM5_9NOCA
MNDTFIRLTDDNGEAFYVRASQIDVIGVHQDYADLTCIQVGGKRLLCSEPVANVIDTLASLVIEVDAA